MTLIVPSIALSKKLLFIIGFLTIGLLLSLYILQLSSMTTMAYNIATDQEKLKNLTEIYNGLEVSTTQTTSFEQMSQLASLLSFEKIQNVTYITDRTSIVANQ